MNDDNKNVVALTVTFITTLYSGLIFMLFWNWFVSPLGVVKINFLWAMGLLLFISITFNPNLDKKSDNTDLDFLKGIMIRTIVLFLGFLCSYAV